MNDLKNDFMNDSNEMKKYIFKKAYSSESGTIAEGCDICKVHGCWFFNGGLVDGYYQNFFESLVRNPKLKAEYLQEEKLIYNKI